MISNLQQISQITKKIKKNNAVRILVVHSVKQPSETRYFTSLLARRVSIKF